MANKDKRYFIPVDGTPIEVSEEVYYDYYRPISPSFVYAVERPFYSVSFLGASSLKTLSAA